jgi:hypothetical protein
MMMKLVQAVRRTSTRSPASDHGAEAKPLWAAKGEINGFCAVIEFYAQEARRITGWY